MTTITVLESSVDTRIAGIGAKQIGDETDQCTAMMGMIRDVARKDLTPPLKFKEVDNNQHEISDVVVQIELGVITLIRVPKQGKRAR